MEIDMQKLLTVNEVAERLRRSPAAVRYMRAQGIGPKSAKVAGRVMWREEDVEAYIEAQFAEQSA
jgi:predicted DNA-binding transcriptional regulator AlpA